jgi:uncharacterized membrane protein
MNASVKQEQSCMRVDERERDQSQLPCPVKMKTNTARELTGNKFNIQLEIFMDITTCSDQVSKNSHFYSTGASCILQH